LYGKRRLLESMDPFLCGGNMIRRVRKESSDFAELPAKFEAGTLPIAEAIALGAAIDYVQSLGLPAISAHEHALTKRAYEQLSQIPGLVIVGPDLAHRGAIVSYTVEGVHPHDMAELLDRRGVAVRAGHHCTMPLHEWLKVSATTRASFALYNTAEEVDALCEAIEYARKVFRRK
jgi:cysteine desulfurase/selenocysteine lyase